MKIAILGTRGIPNRYGGFEQFAELLSVFLKQKGHKVIIYNSSNHPYKESSFEGVEIVHCKDPEKTLGSFGQFIYDFLCVKDSRKRNADIILQLGYTSSSIWSFMFPKSSIIITNMDGLEWKRSKYNKLVQSYLKFAERLAVKKSDFLISDSIGIQNYITKKFQRSSKYIAYGSEVIDAQNLKLLEQFELEKEAFNLIIARIEPENNIETIIQGVLMSNTKTPLVIVGDYKRNSFGRRLYEKYGKESVIRFLGSIYDKEILNNLRYFSNMYFHGHSVGGTNPSLLEAMGCYSLIIAHNNEYNKAILEGDAYYFLNPEELKVLIETVSKPDEKIKVQNNAKKIEKSFNSDEINKQYEIFFYECTKLMKK